MNPDLIVNQIQELAASQNEYVRPTSLNASARALCSSINPDNPSLLSFDLLNMMIGISDQFIEAKFTDRLSKERSIETILRMVRSHSTLQIHTQRIETLCEELALNSIYSSISSYRELTGRDFKWSSKSCELLFGFNEEWVGIACIDPVGSLQKSVMLETLTNVAKNSRGGSIAHHGTSGVGCWMILENSSDLVAVSLRNHWTAFTVRFPLVTPPSKWGSLERNLFVKVIQ